LERPHCAVLLLCTGRQKCRFFWFSTFRLASNTRVTSTTVVSCGQDIVQDRQCTLNVICGRDHATVIVVEKQYVLYILSVCVCSLSYPACNAHASYCHLWSVWLYSIFSHYLINGTILLKKLLNIQCVFRVSLQILSAIFFILRRTERDMIEISCRSACKVLFVLV
jgi:hypothetical protein